MTSDGIKRSNTTTSTLNSKKPRLEANSVSIGGSNAFRTASVTPFARGDSNAGSGIVRVPSVFASIKDNISVSGFGLNRAATTTFGGSSGASTSGKSALPGSSVGNGGIKRDGADKSKPLGRSMTLSNVLAKAKDNSNTGTK